MSVERTKDRQAGHGARPSIAIEPCVPDPALGASEVGPAWLRWLDDKSLAAMPEAGGAALCVGWEDLCAELAPQLSGSDGSFAEALMLELPGALERLERELKETLSQVKSGSGPITAGDCAEDVTIVAAASAECALRALLAHVAGREVKELLAVAELLDAVRKLHYEGPAGALVRELSAERAAARNTAAASLIGYLAFVPLGANARHQGWIAKKLEANEWGWFESAVVPLTLAAVVARALAAGVPYKGRFSVSALAARGRTFGG